MKTLTGHHINDCNRAISIVASEPLPKTGASREYAMRASFHTKQVFTFHHGPIANGVNGITHEAVIEMLTDRFEGLQKGDFACEENKQVLGLLGEIKQVLGSRTQRRTEAGVEGTHEPDPVTAAEPVAAPPVNEPES